MDRCEARRRLERTTAFRFRDGGVVLRDVRLLRAVTALRLDARHDVTDARGHDPDAGR